MGQLLVWREGRTGHTRQGEVLADVQRQRGGFASILSPPIESHLRINIKRSPPFEFTVSPFVTAHTAASNHISTTRQDCERPVLSRWHPRDPGSYPPREAHVSLVRLVQSGRISLGFLPPPQPPHYTFDPNCFARSWLSNNSIRIIIRMIQFTTRQFKRMMLFN